MKRNKEIVAMKVRHLRASEVASVLGIGLSTVWLYAKQGKLTPKKLSDRVTVFEIDDIEKTFKISINVEKIPKQQKRK